MDKNTKIFVAVLLVFMIVFLIFANFTDNDNGEGQENELFQDNKGNEEGLEESEDQEEESTENEVDNIIESDNSEAEEEEDDFVSCLIEKGVVVYASRTCPACTSFANQFGGYEEVEGLFVECTEERERCSSEIKTGLVPEIQIEGELYEGRINREALAEATNCVL